MATGLLALLAKGKPGASKSEAPGAPESAPEGEDMGLDVEETAMQDLGAALKSGDYKAAAAAFKRAYDACGMGGSSEEPF